MGNYLDMPLIELTLRRYESPYNLSKREGLKKICLSLGLLQPGDSRDVIVDILLVLENSKMDKEFLSSVEIRERVIKIREKNNFSINGTAASNIRRQLKRLRDLFIVENIKNKYRILEFLSIKEIYEFKIRRILLEAISKRIEEYLDYYEVKKNEE